MGKVKLKNIVIWLFLLLPTFAVDQLRDDPIYLFATTLTELTGIFLGMWRIIYVIIEIFSLIFVLLTLPILIFKTIKWGIKEVFNK